LDVILPYEIVAKVECCGCLVAIRRGDKAEIPCNECDALIETVRLDELKTTYEPVSAADVGGSYQRTLSALWGVKWLSGFLVNRSLYLQGMRRRGADRTEASVIKVSLTCNSSLPHPFLGEIA
jgi:hypothetical protein